MLLTVVLDYAGGTYLSQTTVDTVTEMAGALRESFHWELLEPAPSRADLDAFLDAMTDESIAEVLGLKHVWCMSGTLGANLALIHLVQTAD